MLLSALVIQGGFSMAIAGSIDFSSGGARKAGINGTVDRSVNGHAASASANALIIDRLPVFAGLSPEARAALLLESAVRHFARKSTLTAEGSVPSHVCVVLQGRLRAVRRSVSGREVILETFDAGSVLVDAVASPERKLANDWEASESTDVLMIPPQVFATLLRIEPSIGVTIMGQMLGRIDTSKHLAAGLALTDVSERVVSALKTLATRHGEASPDGDGGLVIPNRPTQQELANSIGACRETVSRVVSDLTRRGLITPRGRTLMLTRRLLDTIGN
jgi:CRP/FNR family transcriptional regulator, cyclic AMP receptor protein